MIIASKHFPRIITGAVLVSVLGTALYLSGPYLFGLLLLFTLVGLWEFYAMFWPLKANIGGRILGLALGGLLITAAWMRPEMVVMTLALSTLSSPACSCSAGRTTTSTALRGSRCSPGGCCTFPC